MSLLGWRFSASHGETHASTRTSHPDQVKDLTRSTPRSRVRRTRGRGWRHGQETVPAPHRSRPGRPRRDARGPRARADRRPGRRRRASSPTPASRSAARTRRPASGASRSRAPGRRCAAAPGSQGRLLRQRARVLRGDAPSRRPSRSTALAGFKVVLVVTSGFDVEPPAAWLSLVKDDRVHVLPAHLGDEQLAAQVARIALIEEEARLDKRLAKVSRRRKQVTKRLAAYAAGQCGCQASSSCGARGDRRRAACRRPGAGCVTCSKTVAQRAAGGDPDVLEHRRPTRCRSPPRGAGRRPRPAGRRPRGSRRRR